MLVWSLVNRKLIGHHHHRLCIAKRYHQSETIDKALQGAHMHGKYAHLHLWPKTSILKSFISLLIFTSYLFGVKFSTLEFCCLLVFYTYTFFEYMLSTLVLSTIGASKSLGAVALGFIWLFKVNITSSIIYTGWVETDWTI